MIIFDAVQAGFFIPVVRQFTKLESLLSFEGFGGGMLLHRLDHEGICVSTGSACNSKDTQISYVLKAMNLDEDWPRELSASHWEGKIQKEMSRR